MDRKVLGEKQKNILISMKKDFIPVMTDDNKETFVYDTPVFRDFCGIVEADCDTLCRLAEVYSCGIVYGKEDGLYIATCLMRKEGSIVEGLSVAFESEEDFLGLFAEKVEEQKIGVARWLPNNWKELMSDEQKEEIARSWCEEHPEELVEYLGDADKEELADDYVANNASKYADRAFSYLSSYEQRDFIKDCIDNL